jgi:hypothetical protein
VEDNIDAVMPDEQTNAMGENDGYQYPEDERLGEFERFANLCEAYYSTNVELMVHIVWERVPYAERKHLVSYKKRKYDARGAVEFVKRVKDFMREREKERGCWCWCRCEIWRCEQKDVL